MFCKQCGNSLDDNAKFCPACGTQVVVDVVSWGATGTEDTAANGDMRLVIGSNADYYLAQFAKIDRGEKPSFNIAALLFMLLHSLYRRCGGDIGKKYLLVPYLLTFGSLFLYALGVMTISLTLLGVASVCSGVGSLWLLINAIRLGKNFNAEYYEHCKAVLSAGKTDSYGTSMKNVAIFLAAIVILCMGGMFARGTGDTSDDWYYGEDYYGADYSDDDDYWDNTYLGGDGWTIQYFVEIDVPKGNEGYDYILNLYKKALYEEWDMDKLEANNLNYLVWYHYDNDYEDLGAAFYDVDGHDHEIFVIYDKDSRDGEMLDAYIIVDEELYKIFAAGERDRYYMLQNGLIYNEGSSGADDWGECYYRINLDGFCLEEVDYHGSSERVNFSDYSYY